MGADRRGEDGGILSVVGTPIGNLSDVSERVLETLRNADVLLCEDTRVTGKLLSRFGIRVPLERADENVLASKVASTLDRIAAGDRVAFVSDAGMPGVSDPGQRLVDAALDQGLPVEVIPGPSAAICALVASGLPMDHFFFEGFLPRKAGAQRKRLEELAGIPGALVFYESPRRAKQTLAAVVDVLPLRKVALARELTKVHEEVIRGTAADLVDQIAAREEAGEPLKGECVIVVAPPDKDELAAHQLAQTTFDLDQEIAAGLAAGEAKSGLAKRLAKRAGLPKSEVYARIMELG